ncbi:hypothetical protein NDU88_007881 [Pleurodeles waltl]|uniref:Uncharacterized protein n=1 Tax=Pleurodeles waltl TaxID=8319 RepID=A0AAV7QT58_PLEWA|nr:hypothetical protein NDU88_007881 [Pleurodeles waltl]
MCRLDLANGAPPDSKCGEPTSARQILSPEAFGRRADLELRRSRRAIAQALLRGEARRGEPAQAKAGSVPVALSLP